MPRLHRNLHLHNDLCHAVRQRLRPVYVRTAHRRPDRGAVMADLAHGPTPRAEARAA